MEFAAYLLVLGLSVGVSGRAIEKRDVPCRNKTFSPSPQNTMHPTKGKQLVASGQTLENEANGQPSLRQAIDKAKSNVTFETNVLPYGKSMGLSANESLAIFCYTMDTLQFFKDFNTALREGNDSKFPIFHYYLDTGINKLAKKQGNQLRTVYRGNALYFTFPTKETTIAGFTSTSVKKSEAKKFGENGCTMLKLETRYGAYIARMSWFPNEEEVLIPPYEIFSVGEYGEDGVELQITLSTTSSASATSTTVIINLLIVQIPVLYLLNKQ